MIPTSPTKRTTLALNAHFMPIGFFSARNAIRHLVTGGVKAFDADLNLVEWSAQSESELGWTNGNCKLYDDQPSLRSAHQEWPVPTIVVLVSYSGFPRKKNNRCVSLRELFNIYDRTCHYCRKPIPFAVATKDHYIPRSKGGTNRADNMVLACKRCNTNKADKFPFADVCGSTVAPKTLNDMDILYADMQVTNRRPEWETFLKTGKKSAKSYAPV